MDLKNNSSIFLDTGANLLKEFRSLDSTGALVEVDIDTENETIDLDTDNRVYMLADKKLNIAKNQNVTDYGEVSGMSFFGMYRVNNNGTINTGIYNRHNFNDTLDWGGVFDNVSSYVLGLHKTNHDITKDGFYTNYIDEAGRDISERSGTVCPCQSLPRVGNWMMWPQCWSAVFLWT